MEKEAEVQLRFPDVEPIAPPAIQLDEVCFAYSAGKQILNKVNLSSGSDSRICIVRPVLIFLIVHFPEWVEIIDYLFDRWERTALVRLRF